MPSEILTDEELTFEEFISRFKHALSYFEDAELARKRLLFYRWKTTEELDKNILEFENAVKRTGGNVLWGYETADSVNIIKNLLTTNARVAYAPSKISDEVEISSACNVPSLEEFQNSHKGQTPDFLIVQAKFLVLNSGHIYYCTNSRKEFEAVNNAKTLLFLAGVESLVHNGVELELAKNLFSTYEIGQFGYPMEMLLKAGKPDNRFTQQVHLLLVDHGRTNLLEKNLDRKFFPLLNFELPKEVARILWKPIANTPVAHPFQFYITDPLMNGNNRNKRLLFTHNGYNRLSEFLPIKLDMFDYYIRSRIAFAESKKSNFFRKLSKKNFVKSFLEPKTKMPVRKFVSFLQDKIMPPNFNPKNNTEKSFIEQYTYNKRKI